MRRVVRWTLAAALVATAVVAGVVVPGGEAAPTAATKITVTASEFRYVLSKSAAPKGTIVFKLVNKGKLPHDFKIAGKKTAIVAPGKSATLRLTVAKAGRLSYLCTVPGHAGAGMQGTFAAG